MRSGVAGPSTAAAPPRSPSHRCDREDLVELDPHHLRLLRRRLRHHRDRDRRTRASAIAGDPEHPANRGKLCSKGTHLGETVGLEGRLLHPEIDGRRVSWDKAIRHVARRKFADTIAAAWARQRCVLRLGPAADRGLLRRQQADEGLHRPRPTSTPTRGCACRARSPGTSARSARMWCRRATTISTHADLIVLVGSNTAWCHPVVYQRIMAARAARGHQAGGDRPAPHRDLRGGRSPPRRCGPAATSR